jgi:hypothetical protein
MDDPPPTRKSKQARRKELGANVAALALPIAHVFANARPFAYIAQRAASCD